MTSRHFFHHLDLLIRFIIDYLRLERGGGHNGETFFIDFFHVSDHLEQFVGLLFFCGKINYLDRWGVSPPVRGKFQLNN